ncbi:hypothetical protein BUALT_Bualt05G0012900 [Buddleja alternifolia]|uniref:Uncharacterized protein n=1 Tax=Buddleja alternifolia TaxID=168488 RepID=A0AAV6XHI5_9LAMI|nr:hypothetical protein BUALT_Bualt05G0012900 [Buddleja alternifolia]
MSIMPMTRRQRVLTESWRQEKQSKRTRENIHGHGNAERVAGRKRILREDEIVSPTSRHVFKWRQEQKKGKPIDEIQNGLFFRGVADVEEAVEGGYGWRRRWPDDDMEAERGGRV